MFQKIAKVNLDKGWGVELGYEIPQVITNETQMELKTIIIQDNPDVEIDQESVEYKQAESVAEVLKIGFEIGCSYTTKVIEQTTKMGQQLMEEAAPANDASTEPVVTGETSDLILE